MSRWMLWLLLAVLYALVMAWSRTALRVHWLSDVVAGSLWGTAAALWSAVLLAPQGAGGGTAGRPNSHRPAVSARKSR